MRTAAAKKANRKQPAMTLARYKRLSLDEQGKFDDRLHEEARKVGWERTVYVSQASPGMDERVSPILDRIHSLAIDAIGDQIFEWHGPTFAAFPFADAAPLFDLYADPRRNIPAQFAAELRSWAGKMLRIADAIEADAAKGGAA